MKPVELLLVEDNPADVRLVQIAFEDARLTNRMTVAVDGEQALKYLRKEGVYRDARRPDLILLDLNLPRKNGYEVLCEIKADPELRKIALIVLTGSRYEGDVLRKYGIEESCYVVKPLDLDHLINAIRRYSDFGLALVRMPPNYVAHGG